MLILYYTTHIASLLIAPSHTRTKYKMAMIFGLNIRRFINQLMKVGGIKAWKELTICVQQLVRLFLTIILSTPDLSFRAVTCVKYNRI